MDKQRRGGKGQHEKLCMRICASIGTISITPNPSICRHVHTHTHPHTHAKQPIHTIRNALTHDTHRPNAEQTSLTNSVICSFEMRPFIFLTAHGMRHSAR